MDDHSGAQNDSPQLVDSRSTASGNITRLIFDDGSERIVIDPASSITRPMEEYFSTYTDRFLGTFGREPTDEDPFFVDWDAADPTPITLERFAKDFGITNNITDIDPAILHVFNESGILLNRESRPIYDADELIYATSLLAQHYMEQGILEEFSFEDLFIWMFDNHISTPATNPFMLLTLFTADHLLEHPLTAVELLVRHLSKTDSEYREIIIAGISLLGYTASILLVDNEDCVDFALEVGSMFNLSDELLSIMLSSRESSQSGVLSATTFDRPRSLLTFVACHLSLMAAALNTTTTRDIFIDQSLSELDEHDLW